MKKIQTNSPTTFIMENFDKKFIRKYKRRIGGLYAYPRTVPIDKVLKLLEGSGVKHPKLLKNRLRCVDIEYILEWKQVCFCHEWSDRKAGW